MLDRGERMCLHCTLNEVEDESHMLFKCPIYETLYKYNMMQI
jgi:hypothetical protein